MHEVLKTLVARFGTQVLEGPENLRGTLDDFIDEDQATAGEINLLVDAVRLGAYQQTLATLRYGADPQAAIEAASERLARERGSDQRGARWACATLCYAAGMVPEAVVLSYLSQRPHLPEDATNPGIPLPAVPPWPQPSSSGSDPHPHAVQAPQNEYRPAERKRPGGRVVATMTALTVLLSLLVGGAWLVTRETLAEDANRIAPSADPSQAAGGETTAPTEAPHTPTSPVAPTDDATTEETQEPTESVTPDEGPLNVAAPFVNQPCNGQIVVILASSGEPAEYEDHINDHTGIVESETKYLRTDQSCDVFAQHSAGNPIYAAYVGPFASLDEACQERRASNIGDSYVRTLISGRGRDICTCETATTLPRLSIDNTANAGANTRQYVTDLQGLLHIAGYLDVEDQTGYFLDRTNAAVLRFQRDNGLAVDGWVGPRTWSALLTAHCPL